MAAKLTSMPEAGKAVDDHLGKHIDSLLINSSRVTHISVGHSVFEIPIGSRDVVVYRPDLGLVEKVLGIEGRLDVSANLYPPGRTFIPLRAFEIGRLFSVSWDEKTRTASLTRVRDGATASYAIGSARGRMSDGTVIDLDVTPFIAPPGRTMLPLRALSPFCSLRADGSGFHWNVRYAPTASGGD